MTQKLLKNKLSIAINLTFFAILALPVQSIAQAKKVVVICRSDFTPAADASSTTTDPFIKLLQADPRFIVTLKSTIDGTDLIAEAGSISAFYANYDLLVTQESFTGGGNIWKPAGLLGIKNITIPVIYTKLFALQNGRAITDVAGTPAGNYAASQPAGNKLTVTVDPVNQSNPLFTGVTFTGNDVKLFNAGASDAGLSTGATAIKAIDMGFNINISTSPTGDIGSQLNTQLAYITTANTPTVATVTTNPVTPVVGVNPNSNVLINDIPGGTYFGTGGDMLPTTSRMILLSFNYGATIMGYGAATPVSNVTDAGLKIFKNAALILTNQPLGTNENSLASDNVSISPNPTTGLVTVNSVSEVKAITVYDAAGKQVSASKTNTVDLSNQAKGIYLVQVQTENGSTTKKVVVE